MFRFTKKHKKAYKIFKNIYLTDSWNIDLCILFLVKYCPQYLVKIYTWDRFITKNIFQFMIAFVLILNDTSHDLCSSNFINSWNYFSFFLFLIIFIFNLFLILFDKWISNSFYRSAEVWTISYKKAGWSICTPAPCSFSKIVFSTEMEKSWYSWLITNYISPKKFIKIHQFGQKI